MKWHHLVVEATAILGLSLMATGADAQIRGTAVTAAVPRPLPTERSVPHTR